MRTDGRESDYVEDRRGQRPGMGRIGGIGAGRLGIGGIVIALVASYFLGVDPRLVMGVLGGIDGGAPAAQAPSQPAARPTDDAGRFMSKVLADTEDTWHQLFRAGGQRYQEPTLVLFSDVWPTGCGTGQAASGPFYCPADQKIYIDLSFFSTLSQRFQAPGDFAAAYVLAHEVGHHVQNRLGIMDKVAQLRSRMTPQQANALSVRVELQADCFAGIWAHHAQRSRQILEQGDLEEALRAAAAVGDDMLQKATQGRVVPEAFTHGTAEQRSRWFRTGFQTGRVADCDTFSAREL
jgi:predicted metalloprotease